MPKPSKATCLMLLLTEYSGIWKMKMKKENSFIGLTDASYLCHLRNCHFTSCLWRVCLFCSAVQWGLYMCRSWEQSKHLKKVIQCLLCDTILASTKDFVVFAVSRHFLNPLIRRVSRNNKRGKIPSIRKVYRISKRVKVPWIRKESKGFFRLSFF